MLAFHSLKNPQFAEPGRMPRCDHISRELSATLKPAILNLPPALIEGHRLAERFVLASNPGVRLDCRAFFTGNVVEIVDQIVDRALAICFYAIQTLNVFAVSLISRIVIAGAVECE